MTDQDYLVRAVATRVDEPVGIVELIIKETFAVLRERLSDGQGLRVEGFGSFNMREYPERQGRGACPGFKRPVFRAESDWRKQVNGARGDAGI